MLSLATRQIKALRVPSVRQESLQWGHVAAHSVQAAECSGGHGQKLVPCTSWLCPPPPTWNCTTVSITSWHLKLEHAHCREDFQLWINSQGNLHRESVKRN